jgi:hypothetical protein
MHDVFSGAAADALSLIILTEQLGVKKEQGLDVTPTLPATPAQLNYLKVLSNEIPLLLTAVQLDELDMIPLQMGAAAWSCDDESSVLLGGKDTPRERVSPQEMLERVNDLVQQACVSGLNKMEASRIIDQLVRISKSLKHGAKA